MRLASLYLRGEQGFAVVWRLLRRLLIGLERHHSIKSPNCLKLVAVSSIGSHHLRAQSHSNNVSFDAAVHDAAFVHGVYDGGDRLDCRLRKAFITALRIDRSHDALQGKLATNLQHAKNPIVFFEAVDELGHFVYFGEPLYRFDSLPEMLSFLWVFRLVQMGQLKLLAGQLVEDQMGFAEERVW